MPNKQKLFTEFDSISYAQWLEKVEKDLKGRAISSLDSDYFGIPLSPFYHADTLVQASPPLGSSRQSNEWLIDAHIDCTPAAKSVNASILHQLENGVQVLSFDEVASSFDFENLLAQVNPTFIHIDFHLLPSTTVIDFVMKYVDYLEHEKLDLSTVKGNLKIPLSSLDAPLLQSLSTLLPAYRFLYFSSTHENALTALTNVLSQGVDFLSNEFITSKVATSIIDKVTFELRIGKHFFGEIARLRALRILWANILKAYGLPPQVEPFVKVIFNENTYSTDANHNLIAATTMTLSAAIGMADQIWVRPGDDLQDLKETRQRYIRMSRNTQHILKMESFINRVIDPSAGSYYIEYITQQIVERVWNNLGLKD